MEVHLDCLPCNLRQVLEAARLATPNPEIQCAIVLESLKILKNFNSYGTSPEMGRAVHQLVVKHTGITDPYKQLKKESIQMAHSLYPALENYVRSQGDRLQAALGVSAVGNLIDAAVYGVLPAAELEKKLKEELEQGFNFKDLETLRQEAKKARIIVIIGDNAGETVFDKILLTELKNISRGEAGLFFAVRSAPIINDATMEDALASGLDEVSVLLETGSTVAGTIWEEMSLDFRRLFLQADLVVAKGQGNYETLGQTKQRPLYFLLKAKCSLVAEHIGVPLGEYVLLKKE